MSSIKFPVDDDHELPPVKKDLPPDPFKDAEPIDLFPELPPLAPPPSSPISLSQQAAVDQVIDWLQCYQRWRLEGGDPVNQVFRLFGYAGTGKTTVARHIAARVPEGVAYAAFTGKAAAVLRSKGCGGASTIHSLIYEPEERREQLLDDKGNHAGYKRTLEFILTGKGLYQRGGGLVIIDECSMVGEALGRDLLSFGLPVLVLGDPAQLPPVGGAGFFTNVAEPDVLLTEIHRQKEGCGIIDIATAVREGRRVPLGDYSESRVVPLTELRKINPFDYDQVLVGKNATRRTWNLRMRAQLGRTSMAPECNEKLICLRNDRKTGLANGEVVTCIGCSDKGDVFELTVDAGNNRVFTVRASKHYFEGREGDPEWSGGNMMFFGYGYAITTHKSQGSQWPRVLVIDESRVFRDDAARWLYTAVTRAAEHVTVVR